MELRLQLELRRLKFYKGKEEETKREIDRSGHWVDYDASDKEWIFGPKKRNILNISKAVLRFKMVNRFSLILCSSAVHFVLALTLVCVGAEKFVSRRF